MLNRAAPAPVDCSVVMLAHNRERQLPAALAGLLSQRLGGFTLELVLVNDGSTDGTARIARAFRPPFQYQYVERENTNCRAAARNLGVQRAQGTVILFLDSDCVATPDLVATHLRKQLREGHRAVAGGIRLLAEMPSPQQVLEDPAHLYLLPQGQLPYLPRLVRERPHAFITAHCSARREDLIRIGLFDEAFLGYGGEDVDVGVRLDRAGIPIQPAGEVVAFHQPHPPSPDRVSGEIAAAARFREKHYHPWRILHLLEPPDSLELARAVTTALWDRNLSQYQMEVSATGTAAEEVRRQGFQLVSPQEAAARAAQIDLVHRHLLTGNESCSDLPAPGLQTVHFGAELAGSETERPLPLQLKIQYDVLLCGAHYPDLAILAPEPAEAAPLPLWLPAEAKSQLQPTVPQTAAPHTLHFPPASVLTLPPPQRVDFRAALGRPLRVRWEGHQRIASGFARANRELCLELLRSADIELTLRWEEHPWGRLSGPEEERLAPLFALRNRSLSGPPDVTIRHQFPPDWRRPPQGRLVVFQPWEHTRVPDEWVRNARYADEVWGCSRFVCQAFVDSGVPAEQVHLVPLGFNPAWFQADRPRHPLPPQPGHRIRRGAPARTTFLFVGGATRRKGADLLLEAYQRAFTWNDSVRLVVKDLGARTHYRTETLAAEFRRAAIRPGGPEIVYLDRDLDDRELAALYRAGTCLVQPYRGEGFALPPMEAMACGLPVVVASGGPTDDYVDDQTGFRLPFRPVPAPEKAFVLYPCPAGMWQSEVDLDALTAALRWIHEHPEETRQRGVESARRVQEQWTWGHSAAQIRARLSALIGSAPAPVPSPLATLRAGAPRVAVRSGG